jgi:hypothetical protein
MGDKRANRSLLLILCLVLSTLSFPLVSASSVMWIQTYGSGKERAYSLVETSDGGYALTGYAGSLITAQELFWVIKTDAQGIIPEFPSWIILPLTMTATLIAAVLKRRRL